MKKLIPTIFFFGLVAWGVSLWIVVLGHADLVSIGRDRNFAVTTNSIFLIMHVLIGVLFLKRALTLLTELRRSPLDAESIRHPILRDALDP